jgi:beta-glucosidase/6-phospho-beta-glucosidase/beta-galactosidase
MTIKKKINWWNADDLIFAVGVEDTFIPQTERGERPLDEYELTQHYEQWEHDIELIAASGATMVRWGVPWYRVNPEKDRWDWEWLDKVAEKFEAVGVTPILDLMHYGTPMWLDGEFLNPDYPARVAEYAGQVSARYRNRWSVYTPLNEPMLNALYCGLYGYWPPYGTGDADFVAVIRALARGIVATQRAIDHELGDTASFVHVEASFRFVADGIDAEDEAAFLRERAFLLQDLVTGKVGAQHPMRGFLHENGFTEEDFQWHLANTALPDVMGVNYYPAGQTEVVSLAEPHTGGPGDYRARINAGTEGLDDVLSLFAARYGAPVFLTETSIVGTDDERRAWLDASVASVDALREKGVDVIGYTWWSIIDMIEWSYRDEDLGATDYQLGMGLWALVENEHGVLDRVRTPLAEHFRRHATRNRLSLNTVQLRA